MPSYQDFLLEEQLWTLVPTGLMTIAAVAFMILRFWRVMRTISDEEDEVTKMLNRSRREDLHNITNALRATLGHTRRLLDRVFVPMAIFATIAAGAMATFVFAVAGYRFKAEGALLCGDEGQWDATWTVLSCGLCALLGFGAAAGTSLLYKAASPVIALDVAIQVAKDSSASGFALSTASMNWGNTWLGVIAAALHIWAGLAAALLGDYGYACPYAAALFTACAAAGAHAATFVLAAIGSSFAEGMAISLFKVEADTQHRVDGTLRIAANALQSAAGLPNVIGGTVLDLCAVYLLFVAYTSFTAADGRAGHLYLMPALASAALCTALVSVFLAPAQHHRGLIRRARAGMIISTLLSIGIGVAVLYTLSSPSDSLLSSSSSSSSDASRVLGGEDAQRYYYAYGIGALLQLVVVLSIEFTSYFSRVAGEHCDISTTAALNSIASFGSIYAFVGLALVAGALNTVWWAWGPVCCIVAIAGGILSLLPSALAHANSRSVASSALCYSKASLMDPPEQELLEHLLYRCELLEAFAHNAVAYLPTALVVCGCYALLAVLGMPRSDGGGGHPTAVTTTRTTTTAPPTAAPTDLFTGSHAAHGISAAAIAANAAAVSVPFAGLCGVGLAVLSEGLTRFYLSRATWRLHHTVSAIVSTGDSRRPSSISGDSTDDHDDPLQGDRVIGAVAVAQTMAQVLAFVAIKFFIGDVGAVWALMFGAAIEVVSCARHSAEGALGAAVKNFVVQGGMAYAARYSSQHNNAVQAAASSTPLPIASNVISFSIWRVAVSSFLIVSIAFSFVLEK